MIWLLIAVAQRTDSDIRVTGSEREVEPVAVQTEENERTHCDSRWCSISWFVRRRGYISKWQMVRKTKRVWLVKYVGILRTGTSVGDWTEKELCAFAKESGDLPPETVWECADTKKGGGYGRVLVDCPGLRQAMLKNGYAHPFSIGGPAPEADMQALRLGIENKAGIWAKGAPKSLITSLHSQDEKPDKEVYNRVCDLTTGECAERIHSDVYETCQKVCVDDSCMTYVPYKVRYGDNRAECIR